MKEKTLCFIINYGFNDYFSGIPIANPAQPADGETFEGCLRSCISSLRTSFPQAHVLLMTPTHTSYFDNGREIRNQGEGALSAYIKAAENLSAEMNLYFIDNYYNFVITPENLHDYLLDGCHPNEKGRLVIALRIMDFIGDL